MIREQFFLSYYTTKPATKDDFSFVDQLREELNRFNLNRKSTPLICTFIENPDNQSGLLTFLDHCRCDYQNLIVIIGKDVTAKYDNYLTIHDAIIEYPEISFFFEVDERTEKAVSELQGRLFPSETPSRILQDLIDDKKIYEVKRYIEAYIFHNDYQKGLDNYVEKYNLLSRKKDPEALRMNLSGMYQSIRKYLAIEKLELSFHLVSSKDIESLFSFGNLFDASNLRFAIKEWKQATSNIINNYRKPQSSRNSNIAVIIDAESEQCMQNSYVMFANGYRALPITSAYALRFLKNITFKESDKIIVREFDLQFEDEPQDSVDQIRGFRLDSKWSESEGRNQYWQDKDFDKGMFFISYNYKRQMVFKKNANIKPQINNNYLTVSGQEKPIVGTRSEFYSAIPPVKDRMRQIEYDTDNKREYEIIQTRAGRIHRTPLNLYQISKQMTDRAALYFENGNYITAAVVAQEAFEIINGFHQSMAIKAYSIRTISENAIAMSQVGGNDRKLANDAKERIRIIYQDIDRLIGPTDPRRLNVLNQIFSDCRFFCKEKEHFDSEDVFISAMAHLNEGFSIFKPNTWHCLQRMKK